MGKTGSSSSLECITRSWWWGEGMFSFFYWRSEFRIKVVFTCWWSENWNQIKHWFEIDWRPVSCWFVSTQTGKIFLFFSLNFTRKHLELKRRLISNLPRRIFSGLFALYRLFLKEVLIYFYFLFPVQILDDNSTVSMTVVVALDCNGCVWCQHSLLTFYFPVGTVHFSSSFVS